MIFKTANFSFLPFLQTLTLRICSRIFVTQWRHLTKHPSLHFPHCFYDMPVWELHIDGKRIPLSWLSTSFVALTISLPEPTLKQETCFFFHYTAESMITDESSMKIARVNIISW